MERVATLWIMRSYLIKNSFPTAWLNLKLLSMFVPSDHCTHHSLSLMAAQRLLVWSKQTTSEARNIVLGVIRSHNAPISTHEVFEKAVKVPAKPRSNSEPLKPWERYLRHLKPGPTYPDHPIRSLRCVCDVTSLVWNILICPTHM